MNMHHFLRLALALLLASVAGCGGGTSGTGLGDGSREQLVSGRVVDPEGIPLPGVTVRDLISGNETLTASDGFFELRAEPDELGVCLLELELDGVTQRVDLYSEMAESAGASATITFDPAPEINGVTEIGAPGVPHNPTVREF